jgi:TPP-dependent pyruvate/acetoin dehydrogenase alpha subunit
MSKRALAYDMRSLKIDGQDVEEVHAKTGEALEHVRSGEGPVFLDVETYRLHGHYIGDPQVYRSKDDIQEVNEQHDPIALLRERLSMANGDFESIDREVQQVVDEAVEFAKNGTDPAPEDALKNVYA